MTRFMLVMIVLVAILTVGCGSSPDNVGPEGISESGAPGYVYDFEVNGVRCIAFSSKGAYSGAGGVSCDFSG